VGTDPQKILAAAFAALDGTITTRYNVPPLWDGHTADRILNALTEA